MVPAQMGARLLVVYSWHAAMGVSMWQCRIYETSFYREEMRVGSEALMPAEAVQELWRGIG
jgi:hypothetical protein